MDATPSCLGPYLLRERLGVGGMASVYKAEHRLMKRIVALKIADRLPPGRDGSAALARFRREVEAAGRVHHPSIVMAYDAGEIDGQPYLAMEYVDGLDLECLVKNSGPLSVPLACEIVRQTAEALAHVHERGLIHRDIKPSNLMIAPPGVTVKLLDLGSASRTDLQSVPREEELRGTPDYMAPECSRCSEPIDARADLYSLGCTFYFLLTGQAPYPDGGAPEKLLRHSLDRPTPVRQLRPEAPEEIAAVVERLMAREPAERFPTAGATADAIRAATATAPRAATVREREEKPLPHGRGSVSRLLRVAFVVILLAVAVAGGARRIIHSPAASSAPPAETIAPPIQIEGRSGWFASLEKAIAAAHDGDVLTLSGRGPFLTPPLNWQGKALTLRGRGAARPRLVMKAKDDPWQALFHTDRALSLEGLELGVENAADSRGTALLYVEQANLHLRNCQLTSSFDGVAIVARNCGAIDVQGCRIDAGSVALSAEVSQATACRVHLSDNRLTVRNASGVGLSLWAAEERPSISIEMEMHGNTIDAARTLALRSLPAGVKVLARGNRFRFRTTLLSYVDYSHPDSWRQMVWLGGENTYEGPSAWLWVNGRASPPNRESISDASQKRFLQHASAKRR